MSDIVERPFKTRDYAAGFRDGKRDAEATITRLTAENERLRAALGADAQTLRLALGEMTAQEMRTVRAAFNWVLARTALTQEPCT